MSGINVDLFHEHLFFSECLSPDMKFGAQTCIISVYLQAFFRKK